MPPPSSPPASPPAATLSGSPAAAPAPDTNHWFNSEVYPHDGQLKAYLKSSFTAVRDVDDVVQESYLRLWKAKAG